MKLLPAISLAAMLCLAASVSRAQDTAGAEKIFKAKCASCHGADGAGNTAAGKAMGVLDLRSDAVQKLTDAQLIDATANGKGKKMPAYKGKLTDDQIKHLVAYMRELAKKK